MGSKKRITQKLKQNAEYPVLCRFLDQAGLRFTTEPPSGKGHPYLLISLPDGKTVKHSVSCTPTGSGWPEKALAHLKRALRREGYDVG